MTPEKEARTTAVPLPPSPALLSEAEAGAWAACQEGSRGHWVERCLPVPVRTETVACKSHRHDPTGVQHSRFVLEMGTVLLRERCRPRRSVSGAVHGSNQMSLPAQNCGWQSTGMLSSRHPQHPARVTFINIDKHREVKRPESPQLSLEEARAFGSWELPLRVRLCGWWLGMPRGYLGPGNLALAALGKSRFAGQLHCPRS